jgi:hypothetical protein
LSHYGGEFLFSVNGTTPKYRGESGDRRVIPDHLHHFYAAVYEAARALREQGKTHAEIIEELNRRGFRTRTGKPWRHPQQIVKLLRSFGGEEQPR